MSTTNTYNSIHSFHFEEPRSHSTASKNVSSNMSLTSVYESGSSTLNLVDAEESKSSTSEDFSLSTTYSCRYTEHEFISTEQQTDPEKTFLENSAVAIQCTLLKAKCQDIVHSSAQTMSITLNYNANEESVFKQTQQKWNKMDQIRPFNTFSKTEIALENLSSQKLHPINEWRRSFIPILIKRYPCKSFQSNETFEIKSSKNLKYSGKIDRPVSIFTVDSRKYLKCCKPNSSEDCKALKNVKKTPPSTLKGSISYNNVSQQNSKRYSDRKNPPSSNNFEKRPIVYRPTRLPVLIKSKKREITESLETGLKLEEALLNTETCKSVLCVQASNTQINDYLVKEKTFEQQEDSEDIKPVDSKRSILSLTKLVNLTDSFMNSCSLSSVKELANSQKLRELQNLNLTASIINNSNLVYPRDFLQSEDMNDTSEFSEKPKENKSLDNILNLKSLENLQKSLNKSQDKCNSNKCDSNKIIWIGVEQLSKKHSCSHEERKPPSNTKQLRCGSRLLIAVEEGNSKNSEQNVCESQSSKATKSTDLSSTSRSTDCTIAQIRLTFSRSRNAHLKKVGKKVLNSTAKYCSVSQNKNRSSNSVYNSINNGKPGKQQEKIDESTTSILPTSNYVVKPKSVSLKHIDSHSNVKQSIILPYFTGHKDRINALKKSSKYNKPKLKVEAHQNLNQSRKLGSCANNLTINKKHYTTKRVKSQTRKPKAVSLLHRNPNILHATSSSQCTLLDHLPHKKINLLKNENSLPKSTVGKNINTHQKRKKNDQADKVEPTNKPASTSERSSAFSKICEASFPDNRRYYTNINNLTATFHSF